MQLNLTFKIMKNLLYLCAIVLFTACGSDDGGVMIIGWIIAIPIPFILMYAAHWNWIIFANVLLRKLGRI